MSMDEHGNGIEHPDFRVKEHLASGGMGAVLEVEEAATLRPVAVKVMHPEAMASEDSRRRFMLEAQVMARLEHPNIVPMHVLKKDAEGRPFYTMKKVVGRDLQQIITAIRKGHLRTAEDFPLSRLLQIFQKICDAIGYAHSKGVVHRDLKPANVMVGEFGEVLVMDWGLAKIIGQDEVEPSVADSTDLAAEFSESQLANGDLLDVGAGLTMDGALMGTPQYMAPEQAEGRVNEIDGRTDVWALGGILYSILTLHPPITGKSLEELLSKVRTGEIVSPTIFNSSRAVGKKLSVNPDFKLLHCPSRKIPSPLAAIVQQAMQVDPEHRYPTAEDLREDVEAWQNGFATAAEQAGAFKEMGLLLWRHKLVTVGVGVILALAVFFGLHVRASLVQTENALLELRSSIPLFIADIDGLVAAGDYEAAHQRLDQCIKLIPDHVSFYVQKGRLYQSKFEFDKAAEQFTQALNIKPDFAEAMEELTFTRGLADESRAQIVRLAELKEHLIAAKRFAELSGVDQALRDLNRAAERELETWRNRLSQQGAPDGAAARLSRTKDGGLNLPLNGLRFNNLDFVKGIPITAIHIDTKLALNLEPLADLPLRSLRLRAPLISDLSAIKGKKLTELIIFDSRVRDFSLLADMPLKSIHLDRHGLTDIEFLRNSSLTNAVLSQNPKLSDFTPLAGQPIAILWINNTAAADLKFAKEMPLVELGCEGTKVSDISPLQGKPITRLHINRTGVTDLRPLQGAPLGQLAIDPKATDLSPLTGAPLWFFWAAGGRATRDLTPLKDARLREVFLHDNPISDLSPLRGQPLQTVLLHGTRVTDLRPLAGSPIKRLECDNNPLLTDLTGLESCKQLEQISLPKRQLNLDPIRQLPNLSKLVYGRPPNNDWNRVAPVEQYWPVYDKWRRTRVFK